VTGCEKFPEGDLVSWSGDTWFLNSSRGTAREETADLERDVCRSHSSSLHLVPTPAKLEPEGLHLCARFSGRVTVLPGAHFDCLAGGAALGQGEV
jgi:hypothetical protein